MLLFDFNQIHFCCLVLMFSNLDVIKTLISYGSDLSIKDKNGQDIWQLAHLSNNWKALKILPD